MFSKSLKSEEPLTRFEISFELMYTIFLNGPPFSFELNYSLKRILNGASEISPNEYDLTIKAGEYLCKVYFN